MITGHYMQGFYFMITKTMLVFTGGHDINMARLYPEQNIGDTFKRLPKGKVSLGNVFCNYDQLCVR